MAAHLSGEPLPVAPQPAPRIAVDTFDGRVHIEWDPEAPVTPSGQLAFFVAFLKTSGLFDRLVASCPLRYSSPNAPKVRDVLGTLLLSVLSGHWRYAHIAALRADSVSPPLLGMDRILSEDAVRRALSAIGEEAGTAWLQDQLDWTLRPLLGEPWVLDADTTVKPLYGKQEGAAVGYNPAKPGRPSHSYHSFMMGGLRLVLDVQVEPGNEHLPVHAAPALRSLLDRIGPERYPALLRGDSAWGNEAAMREAERREIPFLFRLRMTANVKRTLERAMSEAGWEPAGQGWHGKFADLRLVGWSRHRRIVLLRRILDRTLGIEEPDAAGQLKLGFATADVRKRVWEFEVLATSLDAEISGLGQLYRDRGDAENDFDELKNQWGWGGYTTQDLKRCRLTARFVALVYDWWTLFVQIGRAHV